jgi:hypothetical protein
VLVTRPDRTTGRNMVSAAWAYTLYIPSVYGCRPGAGVGAESTPYGRTSLAPPRPTPTGTCGPRDGRRGKHHALTHIGGADSNLRRAAGHQTPVRRVVSAGPVTASAAPNMPPAPPSPSPPSAHVYCTIHVAAHAKACPPERGAAVGRRGGGPRSQTGHRGGLWRCTGVVTTTICHAASVHGQASGESRTNNACLAAAERAQGRNSSAAASADGFERTSGALYIYAEWHAAEMA